MLSGEDGPVEPFDVPDAPEWNLSMTGLKEVMNEIEDDRATEKEGFVWRTQDSYLQEYSQMAETLCTYTETVAPLPVDRMTLARELVMRLTESVAQNCATVLQCCATTASGT